MWLFIQNAKAHLKQCLDGTSCLIDWPQIYFEFFGFAERCTKTQPFQVFRGNEQRFNGSAHLRFAPPKSSLRSDFVKSHMLSEIDSLPLKWNIKEKFLYARTNLIKYGIHRHPRICSRNTRCYFSTATGHQKLENKIDKRYFIVAVCYLRCRFNSMGNICSHYSKWACGSNEWNRISARCFHTIFEN